MLGLNDSIESVVMKMGQGNPGAMTVVMLLLKEADGLISILNADDMNIHGPKMWLAYNDVCKRDLAVLKEKLQSRDDKMVAYVNANDPSGKPAVTGGASFQR